MFDHLLRFLEGLGACAIMVIPRAVVRDLYKGAEAAKQMQKSNPANAVVSVLTPHLDAAAQ